MPFRNPLWYLALTLAFLLGTGVGMVVAQQLPGEAPAPPPPAAALPASEPYRAPAWQDVLGGKAPLRVLLISKTTMLAWMGTGAVRVVDAESGVLLYEAKPGESVGIVREPNGAVCSLRQNGRNFCAVPAAVRLESSRPISVWLPAPMKLAAQHGPLVIVPTPDGNFSITRELPLEEYLRHVVPAEMPHSFHPQALRAQAIIARTYTQIKLGRHAAEGADLCATEHCQMFGDDGKTTRETDQAVRETRGLVLLAGTKLAETYYSSTCGGATDDAGILWGPEYSRPYLQGVPDIAPQHIPETLSPESLLAADHAYCKGSRSRGWMRHFTAADVNALVARNLPLVTHDPTAQIQQVTNMTVEERTAHGRVASLRVEGEGASILVFGDAVRWLFGTGAPGPNGLWSTLFELTVTRNAAGAITDYTLRGTGRGHGIGLCQWGADGRARAGQNCRDILRAYFPGTRLSDE